MIAISIKNNVKYDWKYILEEISYNPCHSLKFKGPKNDEWVEESKHPDGGSPFFRERSDKIQKEYLKHIRGGGQTI